jgi:hypothetical protein
MPLRLRPLVPLLLALAIGGCGGDGGSEEACRPDDETTEDAPRLTIRQALEEQPSASVRVRGALLTRLDGPALLCSALAESYPPQCGAPWVRVEGLGNPFRVFEGMHVTGQDGLQPTSPTVGWLESIELPGLVERGVLTLEQPCSSTRVIDHFREETGEVLYRDLFVSNDKIDVLNFEAAPRSAEAGRRRREWGRFGIGVFLKEKQQALQEAFEQQTDAIGDAPPVRPDERGIVWARSDLPGWFALKEYDEGVVLSWSGNGRKVTDARWERLDEILSGL